ncbi:MAG TPA: lysylphosphatidylglycerol synthase transmembrane domain-containing protein [Acidobacteriota bacterium]|nr:lysylphosphatidylglycerol synthase transmembrane domain-containing protein [Acidobacteriota bacterium]
MRKGTKLAIKLGITLLLLGALALQMDLKKFVSVIVSADLKLVLLATALHMGIILLAVLRWQVILGNFQISARFSPLTKITFIGQFFNLFLPSAIGGDVFRAYYLSKSHNRGMSTTLTTTLLERSAGLFALLFIGCFFAALHRIVVQGVSLLHLFIGLSLAYVAANVALFHSWMHRKLTSLLLRFQLSNVEAKLQLVYEGLTTLRKNKKALLNCLLLSGVIQFLSVVIMWLAALAINIRAPFYIFLIFIPIVNLTIMVPLTINGFGLRESVYYLLFAQIGLPMETSVTLSLLNFLVVTLASLPGGVAYSLYKKEEHFDAMLSKPGTP